MRRLVIQVDMDGQDKPTNVDIKEFLENLPKYITNDKTLS
jgi:hypothetical protein